ncbi:MAG TPA: hypothetical protein VFR23_24785 [Jiangellaceae bacterium]|nr:hypothetical protein [Jiangellaceae bacterium]
MTEERAREIEVLIEENGGLTDDLVERLVRDGKLNRFEARILSDGLGLPGSIVPDAD